MMGSADLKDPLYDDEIVAKIDVALREDDPEYDDEDGNILTMREEMFSSDEDSALDADHFSGCPPGLEQEPHGWMFQDLCNHGYGHTRPKLSLWSCLRVGKIFIDVQIWQQYCFDVQAGKWVKAWRRDGVNAERYVDVEKDGKHG